MNKNIKSLSKFLSLVLRHKPETISLTLDQNGWARVDEILEKLNLSNRKVTLDELKYVVEHNDKKRFTFNDDQTKIRANQGHSISVDVELQENQPPEFLYHGTVDRFISVIKKEGLKKMDRQHVHLSEDLKTAQNVGSRRGKPVVLSILSKKMHEAGFQFYLSKNGVWLTDYVEPQFIVFE